VKAKSCQPHYRKSRRFLLLIVYRSKVKELLHKELRVFSAPEIAGEALQNSRLIVNPEDESKIIYSDREVG